MRIIFFATFLLNFTILFAQDKNPIKKGSITLVTNQKMEFVNLKYVEDKVVFTNVETKTEFTYFFNSVKRIEDETKTIIYSKPIVEKTESEKASLIPEDDGLFKPNYPEGIYNTKEDFINKKPNQVAALTPKGLVGFTKPTLYTIEHECFFYYQDTDEKVKKVFAVSYKGHLYFQINAILSNRNKTDRAQTNDFPNGFVRVINGGDNYFYTEANLVNQWAQGFAYGGVGGVAGSVLAKDMVHGKGIVWDFKNKEFNIFKNCDDYNVFIKNIYPLGVQECINQQPNVMKIREVIEKIK